MTFGALVRYTGELLPRSECLTIVEMILAYNARTSIKTPKGFYDTEPSLKKNNFKSCKVLSLNYFHFVNFGSKNYKVMVGLYNKTFYQGNLKCSVIS